MTEKRFLKGYHTIRDKEENKIYDFRIEKCFIFIECSPRRKRFSKKTYYRIV